MFNFFCKVDIYGLKRVSVAIWAIYKPVYQRYQNVIYPEYVYFKMSVFISMLSSRYYLIRLLNDNSIKEKFQSPKTIFYVRPI